jgi:hypothetical protein
MITALFVVIHLLTNHRSLLSFLEYSLTWETQVWTIWTYTSSSHKWIRVFVRLHAYSRAQRPIIEKTIANERNKHAQIKDRHFIIETITTLLCNHANHYTTRKKYIYCDMSTSCWVARQGLRRGALLDSHLLNNSRPNTRCAVVRRGGVFSAQPRWRHATAFEYVSCELPRWRHTAARSLPRQRCCKHGDAT